MDLPPPDAEPDLQALRRHLRRNALRYLDLPQVGSVGIGRLGGDGPLCLQVTLDGPPVPGAAPFPETVPVEGRAVPTELLRRAYAPSHRLVEAEPPDPRRQRADPIRPGVSVAHARGRAGTVGLIVRDRQTGLPCLLSSRHVLRGPEGAIGDAVVQPGPFDDDRLSLTGAGRLWRSHLGPAGDAALARIEGRDHDPAILGLDVVPRRIAQVELGDRVVKSGRTTGVTHGIVRRIEVTARLDYGLPEGPRIVGGFEIGPDPDSSDPDAAVALGGDSGAAWLIAAGGRATDILVGLQMAHEVADLPGGHALACAAPAIRAKLDFTLEPPAMAPTDLRTPPGLWAPTGLQTPTALQATAEGARGGYDPGFTGLDLPEPGLSPDQRRDAVPFGGGVSIPYAHFSLCLSAERRMARYVAWNVDGARLVRLPRTDFALDPRIPAHHQWGNELYRDNVLDRGHLARRADLCWGGIEEARQANRDSFFYTNIAPQHQGYNQSARAGLWGALEDHVFEGATVARLRLAVQAGPVFGEEDMTYRGARIPAAFWKLIGWQGEDGAARLAAFVLTQQELLGDLRTALSFDPFHLYQVTLAQLSARTGLDFGAWPDGDLMAHPERASALAPAARGPLHEIHGPGDLLI